MSRPPNILFLLPDQHRASWMGCSGSDLPLRTPHIDGLAEQGVRFTDAISPSPVCAPARACLASGRDYARCGVPSNREIYPLDQPTYYQSLRSGGYEVCGVGKFDLHKNLAAPKADLDWGLDGSHSLEAWGFTSGIDNEGKLDAGASYKAAGRPKGPYMAALHRAGLADVYLAELAAAREARDAYITAIPEELYWDNWIAENGLHFLRGFEPGKPWHLVVNFAGPHNPMDVTPRMAADWERVTFPPPHKGGPAQYSEEDHQRNRRHYAAMIENIDRHVGRFLEAVEARGELENTLIVYSSDHGEMLGDHGRWGKSIWRDASVRIPLIIAGPGIPAGRTSDALVMLHDLAPTFLEYAHCDPLPASDSRSLHGLLGGRTEVHRAVAASALADWQCFQDGRHKAVLQSGHEPRLFDLHQDPDEDYDIAANCPEILQSLIQSPSFPIQS